MIETTPKTFLVGQPQVNTEEMFAYLREVGGEKWFERVGAQIALEQIPDAEGLIEFMGRLCYRSWEPGLNKNVTKIREDREDYLLNILQVGHGSVIEHGMFSFVLHDVSRVLTAELNRHRAGVAISEQSMRFVRLDDDMRFRLPRAILDPESIALMRQAVNFIEKTVARIYKIEGIETAEDFATKKTITSAVRRIAPLGVSTEEGWSANARTIRHVIEMRSDFPAEEEIRIVADQIARKMQTVCPILFGDYTPVESEIEGQPPDWVTENRKV